MLCYDLVLNSSIDLLTDWLIDCLIDWTVGNVVSVFVKRETGLRIAALVDRGIKVFIRISQDESQVILEVFIVSNFTFVYLFVIIYLCLLSIWDLYI